MRTELDVYDDLILQTVRYDGNELNITCQCISKNALGGDILLTFSRVFAYFVIEETADAIAYGDDLFSEDFGFLKAFAQHLDPAEKLFGFCEYLGVPDLTHFQLITRDEIVHVITNIIPRITRS